MSDLTDGLALIKQGVAKIEQATGGNAPVTFTNVKLLSVTGVKSNFAEFGPWTLKFDGGLQIKLQFKPENVSLIEGGAYSGSYTPGTPVDSLDWIAPASVELHAIVVSVDGARVGLVPITGGDRRNLNFQTLPTGFIVGAIVNFSYLPASATGTGFDQFISMG